MVELTRRAGAHLPFAPTTEYINTIPPQLEAKIARRRARWNGGSARSSAGTRWRWSCAPTASPATSAATSPASRSGATLYDVGFNHFWRAPSATTIPGDLLYIQGHSSPGIYARSFLEGRISESQLDNFRMEVDGRGISSYPHPWLMPDYWQTPTVSMGLGPIAAIYQARNWKYLEGRGLMPKTDRKVWCFLGDGETDEPESLGAISRRRPRRPRQPGVRHQLQPAAPRRPGARQRQDHPGAGRQLPRRRLERHQDHLGQLLGSAARARHRRQAAPADDGNRRRRIPELQGLRRRVHARAISSASTRRPPRWSPTCPTTTSGASTAAATIRTRSTPPTTRR